MMVLRWACSWPRRLQDHHVDLQFYLPCAHYFSSVQTCEEISQIHQACTVKIIHRLIAQNLVLDFNQYLNGLDGHCLAQKRKSVKVTAEMVQTTGPDTS